MNCMYYCLVSFGPLAVKSAVCAGSSHPPTAKPALQADRRAVCFTQTSTRGQTAAIRVWKLDYLHHSTCILAGARRFRCYRYNQMRGLQVKVLSDPGQLCRVGSRPVCVRSSCANPCKADHGEINRQIKKTI